MCLIVFAWQAHPKAPLLLAANRDEFYQRPTASADFWQDAPSILAGRDLQAGGTWLGISRSGRFAAITNVRDPNAGEQQAPRSRGELTASFLHGDETPMAYLQGLAKRTTEYQGFNLLVGDGVTLAYLHGDRLEAQEPRALAPGIYGLSNAALDVPWPKVIEAKQRLASTLNDETKLPTKALLRECLASRELAEDTALQGHGLEGEMARRLSAQFIVTPSYGTRCTTTLCWTRDEQEFSETRFGENGQQTGADEFRLPRPSPSV